MRTSTLRRPGRAPAGRSLVRGGELRPAGRCSGPLASTLFGVTRQHVLGLLFGRPDQAFYVREVARLTGGALGAVQRELSALVGAGILERSVEGRQVYYHASRKSPVFEELRSIVAKTSGLADVLRAGLASLSQRIAVAFVFGSMAKDGGTSDSDIDVLVIGDVTLGGVADALTGADEALGRAVNPVVQSKAEFSQRVAADDHFVSRVLAEPKIFLIGDDDVLGRLGTQRLADAAHDQPSGNRRAARPGAARPARQPVARSKQGF